MFVQCMERGFKNLASMGRAASRKGRSPQNGEVDYEVNRDDGLAIDTHSENEAAVEEPHPFSAFSSSSRRATMSNNVSPASFTSPLPSLPNISEGFSHSFSSTSLPGISSIVGPNNLPVTTR